MDSGGSVSQILPMKCCRLVLSDLSDSVRDILSNEFTKIDAALADVIEINTE